MSSEGGESRPGKAKISPSDHLGRAGDDDEKSSAAVDSRRSARRHVTHSGSGSGQRRSRTNPRRAGTGRRRSPTAASASGTRGPGVDPGGVGSVLPEVLAGLGTARSTAAATGCSAVQHLDSGPLFAMPGPAVSATGAVLSRATAPAACQSVVRADRHQAQRLLPRRAVLQPSGAARLLRAAQLVSHHRSPVVHAPLTGVGCHRTGRPRAPFPPGRLWQSSARNNRHEYSHLMARHPVQENQWRVP